MATSTSCALGHRIESIKPRGGIVVAQTLNRGLDEIMRVVPGAAKRGPVSVATAELTSLSDRVYLGDIDDFVDKALW